MRRASEKWRRSLLPVAMPVAFGVVLGACASNAPTQSEDVGGIILKPGDSKTCISAPCAVWFQMPAGSGTYTLLEDDGTRVGDYPAGQKVQIGNYWSSHVFTIADADFPKAHLYVTGDM
jgi:hypothetical protein